MKYATIASRLFLAFAVLNLGFIASGCAGAGAARGGEQEAADLPKLCTDERYLKLKEKNIEDLTEREYEYFMQKDRACDQALAQREAEEQAGAKSGRTIGAVIAIAGTLALGGIIVALIQARTVENL